MPKIYSKIKNFFIIINFFICHVELNAQKLISLKIGEINMLTCVNPNFIWLLLDDGLAVWKEKSSFYSAQLPSGLGFISLIISLVLFLFLYLKSQYRFGSIKMKLKRTKIKLESQVRKLGLPPKKRFKLQSLARLSLILSFNSCHFYGIQRLIRKRIIYQSLHWLFFPVVLKP